MDFLSDLKTKYHAKMIQSSPLRVDLFSHDLQDSSEANNQAAIDLLTRPHSILVKEKEGDLLLCEDAIIFLTKDATFPIKFFCVWKYLLVFKKPAIETVFVWCDLNCRNIRIENKPLGAFCLFKYLLPKYHVVVSASEQTPDGERFEKNQIHFALNSNVYVYVKDEHNQIYQIDNLNVVRDSADVFWGYSPSHRKRVFIYSLDRLPLCD